MRARTETGVMAKIGRTHIAVKQMLADARALDERAKIATAGHAGQLESQARSLRAAAARIAAREREKAGDELDLGA